MSPTLQQPLRCRPSRRCGPAGGSRTGVVPGAERVSSGRGHRPQPLCATDRRARAPCIGVAQAIRRHAGSGGTRRQDQDLQFRDRRRNPSAHGRGRGAARRTDRPGGVARRSAPGRGTRYCALSRARLLPGARLCTGAADQWRRRPHRGARGALRSRRGERLGAPRQRASTGDPRRERCRRWPADRATRARAQPDPPRTESRRTRRCAVAARR